MKIALLIKPFAAITIRADKWLLTSMNAHMCLEVKVETEPLAAQIALIRLFTCVNKHVPLQLGVVQESFATSIIGALE